MPSLDTAVTEIQSLANTYGTPMPNIGTLPGTTSVYRHGPRDILMARDLLSNGSERQVRKVAAHEYFHWLQHANGRNMNNKPFTELEAESMALRWIAGMKPNLPLIPHPMEDFNRVKSLRHLSASFHPGLSSCGFDVMDLNTSGDDGFFGILRRLMGSE
jgi:hypothetical protein